MKQQAWMEFAAKTAEDAGRILLESNRKKIAKVKGFQDMALEADIESEKAIIGAIEKKFPLHNIVSEEAGSIRKGSEFTWCIDPLDGTKNYYRGMPIFSVSIALAKGSEIIAGAVFDPSTKRMYCAEKGKGAFLNGEKISVSETKELNATLVYLDSRNMKGGACDKILGAVYRARNFGVGSLGLCYTAQGGFDAFVHPKITKDIDIAAGVIIAREAGAKVTDFEGRQFSVESESCVAANGALHAKILELLK